MPVFRKRGVIHSAGLTANVPATPPPPPPRLARMVEQQQEFGLGGGAVIAWASQVVQPPQAPPLLPSRAVRTIEQQEFGLGDGSASYSACRAVQPPAQQPLPFLTLARRAEPSDFGLGDGVALTAAPASRIPPTFSSVPPPPPRLVRAPPDLGEYGLGEGLARFQANRTIPIVPVKLPRAQVVFREEPPPAPGVAIWLFPRVARRLSLAILRSAEDLDMIEIAPGSTSQSREVFLRDSNTGQGKTGLSAASLGATFAYSRTRGNAVSVPPVALGSPTAAWSSGGFIEISAALKPGAYRYDFPDASLASGANEALFEYTFDASLGVLNEPLRILLRSPTNNVGAGAIAYTVTVNNGNTSLPLEGASVWVTTDAAGTNVVAGTLTTNSSGQVTFYLDAGTAYVWVRDDGFTGTNPTAVSVA